MLVNLKELVVAASSSPDSSISAWDLYSGALVASYKSSSSERNGLTCVGSDYLAASQIHSGVGCIHLWTWQKSQTLLKSHLVEAIGPVACSSDGAWLAGGGTSGRMYLWEVSSGQLVRSWSAHYKGVSCIVFSHDNSLLVTGGEDTVVSVWSLVSLLGGIGDGLVGQLGGTLIQPMYQWAEHTLPVTSIFFGSCGAHAVVVSASLDHTCKIWSLALGTLLRSVVFPSALNAVVLDSGEYSLFAGGADGRIFITAINVGMPIMNAGLLSDTANAMADAALVGHTRAVSSLAFSLDGICLISGSEDGTCRLWDTSTRQMLRMFTLGKGPVTCVMVLPRPRALLEGQGLGKGGWMGRQQQQQQRSPASSELAPVATFQKYEKQQSHQQQHAALGGAAEQEEAPWEGPLVVLQGRGGDGEGTVDRCMSYEVLEAAAAEMEGAQCATAIRMEAETLRANLKRAIKVAQGWQQAHTELYDAWVKYTEERPSSQAAEQRVEGEPVAETGGKRAPNGAKAQTREEEVGAGAPSQEGQAKTHRKARQDHGKEKVPEDPRPEGGERSTRKNGKRRYSK